MLIVFINALISSAGDLLHLHMWFSALYHALLSS